MGLDIHSTYQGHLDPIGFSQCCGNTLFWQQMPNHILPVVDVYQGGEFHWGFLSPGRPSNITGNETPSQRIYQSFMRAHAEGFLFDNAANGYKPYPIKVKAITGEGLGPYYFKAEQPALTLEDAVLQGNALTGIVVDQGKTGPAITGYVGGERVYGFLCLPSTATKEGYASYRIAEDLIGGDIKRGQDPLMPGSKLLVRLVHHKGSTCYFELALNLFPEDNVLFKGRQLVTHVNGLDPYDCILNLPILHADSMGTAGVGYIPRPPEEGSGFYYKKVIVKGAQGKVGSYVSWASVRMNGAVVIAQSMA